MSSISAYQSPLQLLQSQLQSSVSSGTIRAADEDKLSRALTDIDASLKQSRSAEKSPAPIDLKSKVEGLIDGEVANGKLTSDQASELKSVFADTFERREPAGPRGAGGPGGAGGPPPAANDDDSEDDSADDTSVTGAADVLQQFLKTLQESAEAKAANAYGASGKTSAPAAALNALLFDYKS